MLKYVIAVLICLVAIAVIIFAVWWRKKVREGICPICLIKQRMCKSKLTMKLPQEFYQGGDAATPPMGWSSWNTFRNHIDEKLILETARAMKETGLIDAGYRYLNLDDCWHSSQRDENGELQGDLTKFPSGMGALVKEINSYGLKVGLYTSNGSYTCEDLPASLGHEKTDAQTFAHWGVEYLKYDFCHNKTIPSVAPLVERIELQTASSSLVLKADDAQLSGLARVCPDKKLATGAYLSFLGQGKGRAVFSFDYPQKGDSVLTLVVKKSGKYEKYIVIKVNGICHELMIPPTDAWSPEGRYQMKVNLKSGRNEIQLFNPVCTRADSSYIQYKRMGHALMEASKERKITYSICEWGRNHPESWAWNAGNLWRTTPDITPMWKWIDIIYHKNLKLCRYAGPGHWNDPDMLEVGNGKLTLEENKTHFSLWCMMAAPLILGNDVRKLRGNNDETLSILTNEKMIRIDQDPLGESCICYQKKRGCDYLIKKLSGKSYAVCIYNRSTRSKTVTFDSHSLPSEYRKDPTRFLEIWSEQEYTGPSFCISLAPHGCAVLRPEW